MAIGLENIQNVNSGDGDFPSGQVRDKTANIAGTPANKRTLADYHQFFAKLMRSVSIVPNNQFESEYTGHQYIESLFKVISSRVGKYSAGDDLNEASTNFNDYKFAGIFEATSSFTNKPTGLGATAQLIVGGYNTSVTQRVIDLTNSAEWKRTWNGSAWSSWTLIRLAEVVLPIGDWDVDASGIKIVSNSIATSKIRKIDCIIFSDEGQAYEITIATYIAIPLAPTGAIQIGNFVGPDNNIVLYSNFSGTSWDDTPYNRGYVYISYDPT